jgi:hypothetical protein
MQFLEFSSPLMPSLLNALSRHEVIVLKILNNPRPSDIAPGNKSCVSRASVALRVIASSFYYVLLIRSGAFSRLHPTSSYKWDGRRNGRELGKRIGKENHEFKEAV